MLHVDDQVPHFTVTSLDGRKVSYGDLWQRQNLCLVLVGGPEPSSAADAYLERLRARMADLTAHDTTCVVTRDVIAGLPSPGVLIADRWGEIQHVQQADSAAALPPPAALIEWLRYVQMQCPECQGGRR